MRQCRNLGTDGVLALIPAGARYYVTIDIDAFDPSIAPGTGTPSHGGFLYWEVLEILQGLAKQGEVVGIDLVEVAPAYDPAGITAILAAQVLLNFLGYIFHERHESRKGGPKAMNKRADGRPRCCWQPLGGSRDAAAAVGDPDTVTCAYPVWVGFGPVHLANELGYFEEEGITVEEILDDDMPNALAAMERGDIDCYLRTVGEYQGLGRRKDTQGMIIGTIDLSTGGDGWAADQSITVGVRPEGQDASRSSRTCRRVCCCRRR